MQSWSRHSGEKEWRSPGHHSPSLCSAVRRKMLIIRVMVTTCEPGPGPLLSPHTHGKRSSDLEMKLSSSHSSINNVYTFFHLDIVISAEVNMNTECKEIPGY